MNGDEKKVMERKRRSEGEEWLKYYEGQQVTLSFRMKHQQLLELMAGGTISVSLKGDKFILKKDDKDATVEWQE